MAPSHVGSNFAIQMHTTTADAGLSVAQSFAVPRNARRWHLPKRDGARPGYLWRKRAARFFEHAIEGWIGAAAWCLRPCTQLRALSSPRAGRQRPISILAGEMKR